MTARRWCITPGVAGVVLAAAIAPLGCDTLGGGGGGGTVDPALLEVTDALRVACTGISDSEIEGILETVAQDRANGMSSGQATAQSGLTCTLSPPGG